MEFLSPRSRNEKKKKKKPSEKISYFFFFKKLFLYCVKRSILTLSQKSCSYISGNGTVKPYISLILQEATFRARKMKKNPAL